MRVAPLPSATPTNRPSPNGASPRRQRTIARAVACEGTGLHTGATVRVRIKPGPPGTGVVFVRTDLPGAPRIEASVANRIAQPRRTAIACGDAEVHTVEHLLSAAHGLGVDNLEVELDAFEAPGLDGSAIRYVELLGEAGLVEQDAPRREIVLRETITVEGRNGATLTASPNESGLRVSYSLDYPVKSLGKQTVSLDVTSERYAAEVAPARTFCLKAEADLLRMLGLGLGATFQNTLVFDEDGVIENTLRFPDEAARHKLLDLVGDLALLGASVRANVVAVKSGHDLNLELVRKILAAPPE
ncbi:UDP-3-O-[3-hydroxymyristoyl] N-acetylglucosamine deacetylase [bacterium]|nr:UDP-3-O-[3-hydroxymyristoyl] N-acetylglucosamine deacetylase [bacterium]